MVSGAAIVTFAHNSVGITVVASHANRLDIDLLVMMQSDIRFFSVIFDDGLGINIGNFGKKGTEELIIITLALLSEFWLSSF